MNVVKATFQLFFIMIWTVASSQYTPIINSNRPGLTQGAFSVAPGVYQLEFGTSYRQDQFVSLAQAKSQGAGFTLDLRTGLICLLYTSPSPRDRSLSRMPSSA